MATEVAPGMPDMPPPYRILPPVPSDSWGTLQPCPHTIYWGHLSQPDTHLAAIHQSSTCGARSRRVRAFLNRVTALRTRIGLHPSSEVCKSRKPCRVAPLAADQTTPAPP